MQNGENNIVANKFDVIDGNFILQIICLLLFLSLFYSIN